MAAPVVRRVCSICLQTKTCSGLLPLVQPGIAGVRSLSAAGQGISRISGGQVRARFPDFTTYRCLETSSGNHQSSSSLQSISDAESSADVELVLPNNVDLVSKVNQALKGPDTGRLFAVVHLAGSQFKITTDDIVVVLNSFPPEIGDRIRLEKVLMVGGKDFTMVGRPILDREIVKIEATVIEKTFSIPKVRFHYLRRKGYRRFKLYQIPQTMLVINSIEVTPLDETGD